MEFSVEDGCIESGEEENVIGDITGWRKVIFVKNYDS